MRKSAVAYRANERLIVAPVVRTTAGVGLELEPEVLDLPSDVQGAGNALAHALARSASVVPHPPQGEWAGFFQPFLKAARVRSYKAFMADAQCVHIDLIDGQLILTPQRNRGSKNGFVSVDEEAVPVPESDWNEAAVNLLRLLGVPPA